MTTKGYFGQFGGSFVPEPIQALLDELEVTFDKYKDDPEFLAEFRHYLKRLFRSRNTALFCGKSDRSLKVALRFISSAKILTIWVLTSSTMF